MQVFLRLSFLIKTIIISLALTLSAHADIIIDSWNSNSILTENGKVSKIKITGHVEGLPKNSYHKAISFSLNGDQSSVDNVKFDGMPAKYSIANDMLKIEFTHNKSNNQSLSIEFYEKSTSKKINPYLRREFLSAPPFASGGRAIISIMIPDDMELVSLLEKNMTRKNGWVVYRGKIGDKGIVKSIAFAPKIQVWNVKIKNQITSNQNLANIKFTIPNYFYNGGQRVDSKSTISKPEPSNVKDSVNGKIIEYINPKETNFEIQSIGKVYGGSYVKQFINRNPTNYLSLTPEERTIALDLLRQMKENPDPDIEDLPPYTQISRFVNKYITYDRSYVGKLLPAKDIIIERKGVCTEYATLFNIMARAYGIPSIIVGGVAGENSPKEFEGHSWNMIFYRNQWLQIDPTWDLSSGLLSSSHIYLNDAGEHDSLIYQQILAYSPKPDVRSKVDFEITPAK